MLNKSFFNFDLNTGSGLIESQNGINMKDQRITNVQYPLRGQNHAIPYAFLKISFLKWKTVIF